MNRIGPRASKSRGSDSEYVHACHDYNVIDRHPGTSQIHLLTYLHAGGTAPIGGREGTLREGKGDGPLRGSAQGLADRYRKRSLHRRQYLGKRSSIYTGSLGLKPISMEPMPFRSTLFFTVKSNLRHSMASTASGVDLQIFWLRVCL